MWVGLYLSVGPRRERVKNQGGSERARGRWGTVVRVRTREPLRAGPREEYPSGTPLLPRRYLCHRNPDASCWLWLLAPAAGTVGVPEERRAEEHTVGAGRAGTRVRQAVLFTLSSRLLNPPVSGSDDVIHP